MNDFYIYIYLDPRKIGRYCYDDMCFLFKPFYVGKGSNGRWKNISGRTDYFKKIINKIKKSGLESIVFKLYENLNEKESLDKEIELINEINIKNPGILVNMTDGGEGTSGYKHTEETKKLMSENKRKDFLDIKNEFERRNYILLTEEKDYKNAKQKLKYICPNGHEGSMSWDHFQRGYQCPIEGNESGYKKQRKDFQEIKQEFEKRKYILLTKEKDYKNAFIKLQYICPDGTYWLY